MNQIENLNKVTELSRNDSLSYIKERYEDAPLFFDRLSFHTRPHTRGAVGRCEIMIEKIREVAPREFTSEQAAAVLVGIDKHDTIQISTPVAMEGTHGRWMLKRQRATGRNEEESAEKAMQFLDADAKNTKLSSRKYRNKIQRGIRLTKPLWSTEYKTVVQENFADAPLEAQLIALSDLSGVAMQGKEVAVYEAVTLYEEDNLDYQWYREILRNARRGSSMRDANVELFLHERLVGWINSQIDFNKGRQQLVWSEIDSLNASEKVKNAVRSCFSNENYNEAIASLEGFRDLLIKNTDFSQWTQILDSIVSHIPPCLQDATK